MGFSIAKASVLLQLFLSFLTVFGDILSQSPSPHPYHHSHYLHPQMSPTPSPAAHHHHHHGHAPSPSSSPVLPPTPAPSHHHHHHAHPPSHSPVHPPTHSPVHPPPPMRPPTLPPKFPPGHRFPRSFVAVQGVVYCKPCKYAGVGTLLGAKPLSGATVKLQCYNTKYRLIKLAKTDSNGYFYMEAPKTITSYGAHKCKVFLVSSPATAKCPNPSDLHGGLKGAILNPQKSFVSQKLPFVLYSVWPLAFEPKCPR